MSAAVDSGERKWKAAHTAALQAGYYISLICFAVVGVCALGV